jgi:cob(I)alamin adenosyltransferase
MKATKSANFLTHILNSVFLPARMIRAYLNPYSNLRLFMALKRRHNQSNATRQNLEQAREKLLEYEKESGKSPFYVGIGSRGRSKVAIARTFIAQSERRLSCEDLDGALENSLLAKRKLEEALAYLRDGFSEHDMVGF